MATSMPTSSSPSSNLNKPKLQLKLSLVELQAPVVVGMSLFPPHPAHIAWYTVPSLSKREVPPSTCSAEVPPPKNVA